VPLPSFFGAGITHPSPGPRVAPRARVWAGLPGALSRDGAQLHELVRCMWRKKSCEWCVGTSAFVLLSAGTLLVAFQYQDSWGGIILLPVYLYMLYLLL
jgi:hypothetical protein